MNQELKDKLKELCEKKGFKAKINGKWTNVEVSKKKQYDLTKKIY